MPRCCCGNPDCTADGTEGDPRCGCPTVLSYLCPQDGVIVGPPFFYYDMPFDVGPCDAGPIAIANGPFTLDTGCGWQTLLGDSHSVGIATTLGWLAITASGGTCTATLTFGDADPDCTSIYASATYAASVTCPFDATAPIVVNLVHSCPGVICRSIYTGDTNAGEWPSSITLNPVPADSEPPPDCSSEEYASDVADAAALCAEEDWGDTGYAVYLCTSRGPRVKCVDGKPVRSPNAKLYSDQCAPGYEPPLSIGEPVSLYACAIAEEPCAVVCLPCVPNCETRRATALELADCENQDWDETGYYIAFCGPGGVATPQILNYCEDGFNAPSDPFFATACLADKCFAFCAPCEADCSTLIDALGCLEVVNAIPECVIVATDGTPYGGFNDGIPRLYYVGGSYTTDGGLTHPCAELLLSGASQIWLCFGGVLYLVYDDGTVMAPLSPDGFGNGDTVPGTVFGCVTE